MSEQLPHIVPGQPRRSMYGEHNTHDEQVALTAAAFQHLVDNWHGVSRGGIQWPIDEREPIRVVAEVGRPVREVKS